MPQNQARLTNADIIFIYVIYIKIISTCFIVPNYISVLLNKTPYTQNLLFGIQQNLLQLLKIIKINISIILWSAT